jgi:hypothetical protein
MFPTLGSTMSLSAESATPPSTANRGEARVGPEMQLVR